MRGFSIIVCIIFGERFGARFFLSASFIRPRFGLGFVRAAI